MSMSTVAEYVETREIRARVALLGVDYGQGFAIGRPTPLAEMLVGAAPAACRRDVRGADAAARQAGADRASR